MSGGATEPGAPHQDPEQWDEVLEAVGPASMMVVIGGWMGERLRTHYSPEDAWQDTLLLAWRDRGQHEWEGTAKYRAWLLGIARNRIRDAAESMSAAKRGGGVRPIGLGELAGSRAGRLSSVLPGRSTTPSRILQDRQKATLMEQALEGLPDDLQAVLRLKLFEDLPMEEVTSRLDIPVSTGWYRFRRGSQEYAKRLESLRSRF